MTDTSSRVPHFYRGPRRASCFSFGENFRRDSMEVESKGDKLPGGKFLGIREFDFPK